jgi:hypothetical protein
MCADRHTDRATLTGATQIRTHVKRYTHICTSDICLHVAPLNYVASRTNLTFRHMTRSSNNRPIKISVKLSGIHSRSR